MLLSERGIDPNSHLVTTLDPWAIYPLQITLDSSRWLWQTLQQYRTLFSDVTLGDVDNFVKMLTLSDTEWFVVVEAQSNVAVGVVYLTDIHPSVEFQAHVVFFDRDLASKATLCAQHLAKCVKRYGVHRVSAVIPDMYHATIRLAKKVGFKEEGRKRESVLVGGQWRNEVLFGLLASELVT